MNKLHLLAMVTGLGLLIAGSPAWALTPLCEPPACNSIVGDVDGNTAGGGSALLNVVDYTPITITDNTAFGDSTLQDTTSGYGNTAIGGHAMFLNTTGNNNTASGVNALYSNNGGSNTADGASALSANTNGGNNTAIGASALQDNTIGGDNTAVGAYALSSNTGANSDGGDNTAIGAYALNSNIGNSNTAIGRDTLFENTGGNYNTAIGKYALYNAVTGDNNIALGYNAGSDLTYSDSNNIDIGSAGVAADSGTIRIGIPGQQSAAYIQGVYSKIIPSKGSDEVYISNTGQLGTKKSSARYKRDIHDMGNASAKLLKLRAVSFRYKEDPTGTIQYGLVAEEVERVYPELVSYGADGKVESVHYTELTGMLLNELQKQASENARQTEKIRKLSGQVAELKAGRDRDRAQRATFDARLSALEQTTQARNGGRKLAAAFDR